MALSMARPRVMRPDEAARREEADKHHALALVPVSRETQERFSIYVALLRRWQSIKNLVGPSTLDHIWTRHIADSAQIVDIAPEARRWIDMGSGAGFPGLVVAILLQGRPGAEVHLIESNARKCAFLREAARETGAPAIVHNGRVEDVTPRIEPVDILTARALAPLSDLLELGTVAFERGAAGLFLKTADEIAAAPLPPGFRLADVRLSRTSNEGRIILVQGPGRHMKGADRASPSPEGNPS